VQHSAGIIDWLIFSIQFGLWPEKRAYEPICMFQIVSYPECRLLIDDCSMAEHLRISDSQCAVFADLSAPTLANDVCDDIEQIVIKFCGQICKISDVTVKT